MEAIEFKKGGTFQLEIQLPKEVLESDPAMWLVESRIRRYRDSSKRGNISTLNTRWMGQGENLAVSVEYQDTSGWPIGLAEVDARFISVYGKVVYSDTVAIKIVRSIS